MNKLMLEIKREPVWMAAPSRVRSRIPPVLRPWLFDTSSLTKRLQQCCREKFHVRLLQQRWQRPMVNERRVLGIHDSEYALVRHVHLMCGRRQWVFARTVIPLRTMKGAQRQLAYLGEKPLGALLFADKTVRRGPVEVARITPDHALLWAATGESNAGGRHQTEIWGRRSLFYFGAKPLLVSEIFLPAHCKQT